MGTRNLTMVIHQEKPVIAQYGQWDGYPGGQGIGVLNFIKGLGNIMALKNKISRIRFVDIKGKDKEFIDSYNRNAPVYTNSPDLRTKEQKRWFEMYITRDLGAKVLDNIIKSEDKEILLNDRSDFIEDSLFCEWAYLIDLDKNTFEVYEGFVQSEMDKSERFYKEKPNDSGYYPCICVKKYPFGSLPTDKEFIDYFNEREEE